MEMTVRLHPLEFTQRHLPFVCALTGEPAAWYRRVHADRPPHPAVYLLLLLGPLGWLILLFAVTRSDGTAVEIPISQYVYDQIAERRRRFRWLTAAMIAEVVVLIATAGSPLWPALWIIFVPVIAMGFWVGMVKDHRIRLTLDGVGLVTIHTFHPNFVAAIERWRQSAPAPTPRP